MWNPGAQFFFFIKLHYTIFSEIKKMKRSNIKDILNHSSNLIKSPDGSNVMAHTLARAEDSDHMALKH